MSHRPAPRPLASPDPASASAELSVIADTIERHRERVAALTEPFLGTERDDVMTVLHEADRQLQMATRTLRRAIKTLAR